MTNSYDFSQYQTEDQGSTKETWFKAYWRPAMAWLYAAICAFDFIIAPTAMMILPVITKAAYVAWVPLTLQNGGLVHLSFGAIVGLYTWGRTKEKIITNGNGELPSSPPSTTTPSA